MRNFWEGLEELGIKSVEEAVRMTQYAAMHLPKQGALLFFVENRAEAERLAEIGHADAVDEIYEDMQTLRFLIEGGPGPLQEVWSHIDLEQFMQEMWEVRKRAYARMRELDEQD